MKHNSTRIFRAVLTMVLFAGGIGSGWLQAQTSHQVSVRNNLYSPKELIITAGDTVVWKNTQGVHNVNGNKTAFPDNPVSFGNGLGANWTYSYVFTIPGVYNYQCDPHTSFGMYGKVTVLSNPNNLSLTVAFAGMNPHVGQVLWLSVTDVATGEEAARTQTEVRQTFELMIKGLKQGRSYNVDFYADHNGNGRYDAPPADHAWRLQVNSIAGDTRLNFTHNTNFTNIAWRNKLTVDFAGMTPHVGQMLSFYVKEAPAGPAVDTIMLEQVPAAAFSIHSYAIVPGRSYTLDFFADHNRNGRYDAPPVDHAWRMNLLAVAGDTVLTFTHNTNFTDIFAGSSAVIPERVLPIVRIYPNPVNSKLNIDLNDSGSERFTVSLHSITGALMMSQQYPARTENLAINVSDFPEGLYFLTIRSERESRSYRFIKQ